METIAIEMSWFAVLNDRDIVEEVMQMPSSVTGREFVKLPAEDKSIIGKRYNRETGAFEDVVYYYAFLNGKGIVVDIFTSDTETADESLIAIGSNDRTLIGKWYDRENDRFIDPPAFVLAAHSTDEICYKQEDKWLSAKLDEMEESIAAVEKQEGPQGEKGDIGPMGPQGIAGPQGQKGDKGDVGASGPQGIQGPKGDKGDTGAMGPQGKQGIKGDMGPAGPQGIQGPKGEIGATGPQGPAGITATSHGTQIFTKNGTWKAPTGVTCVTITAKGGGGGGGAQSRVPGTAGTETSFGKLLTVNGGGGGGIYNGTNGQDGIQQEIARSAIFPDYGKGGVGGSFNGPYGKNGGEGGAVSGRVIQVEPGKTYDVIIGAAGVGGVDAKYVYSRGTDGTPGAMMITW